jgi:hypothetical protein
LEKTYFPTKCTVNQLLTEKPRRPFKVMKFKLVFRSDDRKVHEVEVKNINLQDLRRHLQNGESVNIVPEFTDGITDNKEKDRHPWYFIHL